MADNEFKDSITKTYGIRSGEPKRPESLIEIPSVVPEVPEVSLYFNQEKIQSPQINKTSTNTREKNYSQQLHQSETLQRNKNESYNTWRAKNSQALHSITSGIEKVDLGSKRATSVKRSAGLVRKQYSESDHFSPLSPTIPQKHPSNGSLEHVNSTLNGAVYSPQINSQSQMPASIQQGKAHHIEHQHEGQSIHKHQLPRYSQRDSQQIEENVKIPSSHSSNFQKSYGSKGRIIDHIPCNYQMGNNIESIPLTNGNPVLCVPTYCNHHQCSCGKQNVRENSINGNQFCTENHTGGFNDNARNNMQFLDNTRMYSPLEYRSMNSHLSSLSHVVSIQKEQIALLCQEMNSQKVIMSALLEQVKQIHAAVSPNTHNTQQVKCDPPPSERKSCQCCNCEHKNDQDIRNNISEESDDNKMKGNDNSTNKEPSVSPNSVKKRSIGVMTAIDNSSQKTVLCSMKEKFHGAKENVLEVRKQNKKSKAFKSPSPKSKQGNKNENHQIQKNWKPQLNKTKRRKKKKDEPNESSQSEDSFSLDEAAVVVRNETEESQVSPEVSIHVNMPDYSATSDESDTSSSSESGNEDQGSGTEGESSDPQIGWTFYDRVVGQVNNMLKKTSHEPRRDHTQRKNQGNVLYQCNEDYEAENNWSKRVTFDGPPLEDSDNNGMHMPRYHHFRANPDFRNPAGGERVQDFLVCDYANAGNNMSLGNGSANVSFATYRYYQRHQLLPPPPPPEQVFPVTSQTKKKDKTRKNERTPPTSQKSHKRRSGQPPSKILDMSALKHQPKLF